MCVCITINSIFIANKKKARGKREGRAVLLMPDNCFFVLPYSTYDDSVDFFINFYGEKLSPFCMVLVWISRRAKKSSQMIREVFLALERIMWDYFKHKRIGASRKYQYYWCSYCVIWCKSLSIWCSLLLTFNNKITSAIRCELLKKVLRCSVRKVLVRLNIDYGAIIFSFLVCINNWLKHAMTNGYVPWRDSLIHHSPYNHLNYLLRM